MANIKFQAIANNHRKFIEGLNTVWTPPKVRQVSAPPFNWITPDEAEAIVATEGDIMASWYDWQHDQDPAILGQNMVPTPDDWSNTHVLMETPIG